MTGVMRLAVLAVLLTTVWAGGAPAQTVAPSAKAPSLIKVGIIISPPFVMKTQTGYDGMAIDLWEDVADKLGLTYRYEQLPTLKALLSAIADHKIDIAVMNITITEKRLQSMDFTQPWFDAGLRVMINQNRHNGMWNTLEELWDSGHIQVYLWMFVIILVVTILLTLVDRRFDEEFPREWHKGLADSFYHVMSIATSGKSLSHKQLFGVYGRILAAVWMVFGVGVVAYVTSSVTSVMTVSTITNQINSRADLPGKVVGVVDGSVGESYALDEAFSTQAYPTLTSAVHALLNNDVAAIVDDAAVLEFYDHSHPEMPITEVGAIFQPSKYGFAAPLGSPLTRPISVEIVADQEEGLLGRLHTKYFGLEP